MEGSQESNMIKVFRSKKEDPVIHENRSSKLLPMALYEALATLIFTNHCSNLPTEQTIPGSKVLSVS